MGANQSTTSGDNNKTPDGTISSHVHAHQVVIFSKRTCGYCDAVKAVIDREVRRLRRSTDGCVVDDVKVIELDDLGTADGDEGAALQEALVRRTGMSTVPQVFVGRKFVGGAVDTNRMANSGGLRLALMQAANCPVVVKNEDGEGVDGDDGVRTKTRL